MVKLDVIEAEAAAIASRPMVVPITTKAIASASVSRTVVVVAVRRSGFMDKFVGKPHGLRVAELFCGSDLAGRRITMLPSVAQCPVPGAMDVLELKRDALGDE